MLNIKINTNKIGGRRKASRQPLSKHDNTFSANYLRGNLITRPRRAGTPIAARDTFSADRFGSKKQSKFGLIRRICLYSSMLKHLSLIDINNITEEEDFELRNIVKIILDTRKKKQPAFGKQCTHINTNVNKTVKDREFGDDLKKLFSLSSSDNHEVFKSLAKNLTKEGSNLGKKSTLRNISFLQICAIKISKASWECIGKAISGNKSIKTLALNACGVNNDAFEYLVPAMKQNKSIEILDLSCNYMRDEMSTFISKIISLQSERRDQAVWLAGLREELPEQKELKSGLKSLILRHNDFSQALCSDISRVLYFDIYLKSLDLRNNLIEAKGIKEMKYFLNANKSLINLDIRQNPGLSSKLHRTIVVKLLRNIGHAKRTASDEMRWMNAEVLICEVPRHLAPKIQRKMNELFEYPSQVFQPQGSLVSESTNFSQTFTSPTPKSTYSKLIHKKVRVKNLKTKSKLKRYQYSSMQKRGSIDPRLLRQSIAMREGL
ncbi:unnamed protein product [Moneuplotes crassus]|uniref:Uncharacterized protein n=1 Tax=Euplotes crassus TaxID=5936 RepID=A0AAD1UC12_EUPCR|nr:unnamed protein product [Moneuplotes crassus]